MQPNSPDNDVKSFDLKDLNPIQLEYVAVRELTIKTKRPAQKTYEMPEGNFALGGKISKVRDDRRFQVFAHVTIGSPEMEDVNLPFYLRVEIVGQYSIEMETITSEQATQWAFSSAQFTLLPYLREHVSSLTGRAGFTPILMPLIQLPTPPPPDLPNILTAAQKPIVGS